MTKQSSQVWLLYHAVNRTARDRRGCFMPLLKSNLQINHSCLVFLTAGYCSWRAQHTLYSNSHVWSIRTIKVKQSKKNTTISRRYAPFMHQSIKQSANRLCVNREEVIKNRGRSLWWTHPCGRVGKMAVCIDMSNKCYWISEGPITHKKNISHVDVVDNV